MNFIKGLIMLAPTLFFLFIIEPLLRLTGLELKGTEISFGLQFFAYAFYIGLSLAIGIFYIVLNYA